MDAVFQKCSDREHISQNTPGSGLAPQGTDCLSVESSQPEDEAKAKNDTQKGMANGTEPICGSCVTGPRCHPVDPSNLHSLCYQLKALHLYKSQ